MLSRSSFICLILIGVTLAVYWPVGHFGFVNFDDFDYITDNPRMQTGLTRENLVWAFTTFYEVSYHPTTWISMLLDCSVFGQRAQPMHVENVLWHAANAVLLYWFLLRATGCLWPSAFTAAVFALHPTHVESVAWISERKDVLSTFFSLLALTCYLRYVDLGSASRRWAYMGTVIFFTCGVLAKSMVVTFPFLLLLLDYWPLCRLGTVTSRLGRNRLRSVIIEKSPLFLPVLAVSVLTYKAQQSVMTPLRNVHLGLRAENVVVSYVAYLGKNFWPANLSVLYFYRSHVSFTAFVSSLTLLLIATLLFIQFSRSKPYLIVGWLWFLGTLVPVIGIIQVGEQSMADRYLYLPSIGLSIMLAWAAQDLLPWIGEVFVTACALVILLALGMVARHQVWYWQDTQTLLAQVSRVADGNAVAEVRLGYEAARRGDSVDAERHYLLALKADPKNYAAEFDLGNLFLKTNPQIAAEHFRRAAENDPTAVAAQTNWGVAMLGLNQPAAAFDHFHSAETLDPAAYDPHYNLGQLLLVANRFADAHSEFLRALQARPNDRNALAGLHASESSQQRR